MTDRLILYGGALLISGDGALKYTTAETPDPSCCCDAPLPCSCTCPDPDNPGMYFLDVTISGSSIADGTWRLGSGECSVRYDAGTWIVSVDCNGADAVVTFQGNGMTDTQNAVGGVVTVAGDFFGTGAESFDITIESCPPPP